MTSEDRPLRSGDGSEARRCIAAVLRKCLRERHVVLRFAPTDLRICRSCVSLCDEMATACC